MGSWSIHTAAKGCRRWFVAMVTKARTLWREAATVCLAGLLPLKWPEL